MLVMDQVLYGRMCLFVHVGVLEVVELVWMVFEGWVEMLVDGVVWNDMVMYRLLGLNVI